MEHLELGVQQGRHHSGQKSAAAAKKKGSIGIDPIGDGHRRDGRAQRQAAVHRQIGEIEHPKGEVDPDDHDAVDQPCSTAPNNAYAVIEF